MEKAKELRQNECVVWNNYILGDLHQEKALVDTHVAPVCTRHLSDGSYSNDFYNEL